MHDGCSNSALRALIPPTVYVGPRTPSKQHVGPADGTKGWTSSNCVAVPTSTNNPVYHHNNKLNNNYHFKNTLLTQLRFITYNHSVIR